MKTFIRTILVFVSWAALLYTPPAFGSNGIFSLPDPFAAVSNVLGDQDFLYRNRKDAMFLTASADALYMDRVSPKSNALLTQGSGGAVLLNSNDIDFDWKAGPRVSIIAHDVPFLFGFGLELNYMSLDGFKKSESVVSDGTPVTYDHNGWLVQQSTAGHGIQFDYGSFLNSSEANLRYDMGKIFSVLGGFRWVELHDRLNGSTFDGSSSSEFLSSNADNHMYGFQLGIDAEIPLGQKLRVAGVVKAGVYANYMDQNTYITNQASVYGKRTHTAFLGEASLMAVYNITNNLGLRAGYQVMWIEGAALASDQVCNMSASDDWKPYTGGSLFYHGAFAGIEFKF